MTTSGYTLLDIPNPQQFLVHVHPSPDELGSVYRPDLPIAATASAFAEALAGFEPPAQDRLERAPRRAARRLRAYLKPIRAAGRGEDGRGHPHRSPRCCPRTASSPTAPATIAAFVHRYFEYKGYRTQLAPTSGSMGYGLPAAIAAKLAHPDARRRQLPGRRLFPDDGPGAGDRRAIRAADRHHHRQQRHVRHDPHASGARVSPPRRRHHADQSRTSPPTRAASAPTATPSRRRPTSRRRCQARCKASKPSVIELKLDPEALSAPDADRHSRAHVEKGAVVGANAPRRKLLKP